MRTKKTVVVLNGWGSSVFNSETRTAALVREACWDHDIDIFARRAHYLFPRTGQVMRHILQGESSERSLLLVGKSLGARNIVRVMNRMKPLMYRKTGILTIDPCWPLRGDWRPNLNGHHLICSYPIGIGYNVYVRNSDHEAQVGARIGGSKIKNIGVSGQDYDHYTVTQCDVVEACLESILGYLDE